ncbi:hypothetical protein V8G54_032789 [Vigna mungo]|uniref:ADP-ribosylation factor-like protein 3 n=1 Tax=Vigna mungo TaxID=3915 RepID=A0AAQ3RH06_VIGMU
MSPGLRSIWEKYYEEAHAVIFVIDAASPSRFEDAKSALVLVDNYIKTSLRFWPEVVMIPDMMKTCEKVLRHEDLQGAPLLILANKQDLPEAVSAEELARYLDLKKLDERVYMFEAVIGIRESAEWLVEVMERSKRTEMLRARAGAMGSGP